MSCAQANEHGDPACAGCVAAVVEKLQARIRALEYRFDNRDVPDEEPVMPVVIASFTTEPCAVSSTCEHVWDGPWREEGLTGEATCSKCGLGAIAHSLIEGP